jgi:hypothetical protein
MTEPFGASGTTWQHRPASEGPAAPGAGGLVGDGGAQRPAGPPATLGIDGLPPAPAVSVHGEDDVW